MDVVREDGHSFLTVAEPGMLGKIGMSSAGVGCLLNAIDCGKHLRESNLPLLEGVPIHILLRSTLDASSYDIALSQIEECVPNNTSSHIFLASADGESALIEFAGCGVCDIDRSDVQRDQDSGNVFRVHTNHYLKTDLASHSVHGFPKGAEMTSSRSRYLRAMELVKEIARQDTTEDSPSKTDDAVRLAKRILGDDKGALGDGVYPICMPFTLKSLGNSGFGRMGKTGTVCTVVMDLANHTMHLTRGSPLEHDYEVVAMRCDTE